jgi:hypothetical protein
MLVDELLGMAGGVGHRRELLLVLPKTRREVRHLLA